MKEQYFRKYHVKGISPFDGKPFNNCLKVYVTSPDAAYEVTNVINGVWEHAPEWKCGADYYCSKEDCIDLITKHCINGYSDAIDVTVTKSLYYYHSITTDMDLTRTLYVHVEDNEISDRMFLYGVTTADSYIASWYENDKEVHHTPFIITDEDELAKNGWVWVDSTVVTCLKEVITAYNSFNGLPCEIDISYYDSRIDKDIFHTTFNLNEADERWIR